MSTFNWQKPPEPGLPSRATRAGVYASAASRQPTQPKPVAQRNPDLLKLARDKPCLLQALPRVTEYERPRCLGEDGSTTVAAHGNLRIYGKAGSRKANDYWSVFACVNCHHFLDQDSGRFSGSRYQRKAAFEAGMVRQLEAWRAMLPTANERDAKAIWWALDFHLQEQGEGLG